MFLEYYGLREQPFGVTPDPRFLYFGATHREALASLFYGIESGCGFLALIAPPGMGKTTLLFHLLEKLRSSAQTVFLFQTQCGSREMFRHLLNDLGIDSSEQDLPSMHESLNNVLLSNARKGRRVVLVIDEAQNLRDSVLETVRLLSDFETPQSKLLQIILSGQPQLADKLSQPGLTQLRQRISVIGRLHPFTRVETMVYLEYRLCKAGYSGPPLFSYGAVDLIAANSKGIPRTINNLCFNALTLGFAKRQKQIDAATMREVMADFDLEDLSTHHSTAAEASDDALSSFDGISPSNELTYQDFHDAVRAAWGNGAPVKREDRPAEDIPKWAGSNGTPRSVDTVFRMSVQTEEALSTSFDLDHPQGEDDAKSLGSLPTPSVPASGVADQVSPDPWQDESQSEQNLTAVAVANGTGLIDEPSTSNHHAAQLETKNAPHGSLKQTTMNATSSQATEHLHSQHPTEANYLSAPLLSKPRMMRKSSRRVLLASWRTAFRTWHDAYKKWMGAADNGRAIFGKTVVAVALALIVSGLVFAWRHPEFMRVPINAAPVAPAPSSMVPLQPSPAIQGSQSSQMRADKVSAPPGKPKRRPVVIIYEQGQTLGAPSLRSLGKFDAKVSPEGNISNQEIKNPDQVIEGTQLPLPGPQVHAESSAPSSGGALNRAQDQP